MKFHSCMSVFLMVSWAIVVQAQVEKQDLKQNLTDVRIVATKIHQTLNGLADEDEADAGGIFGRPHFLDSLSVYFQVEGEGHRHLLSARLESIIGPDGKGVPIGHSRSPDPFGEKVASLEMESHSSGNSMGRACFQVRLPGEEFSKSSRVRIRGMARVAVGGNLKRLDVEVDSDTCKKIKVEPYHCRYFEDDESEIRQQGRMETIGILTLVEGGIYVGAMGVFQAISGKGNIFDSIGVFFRPQPEEEYDLIKIYGPVHYLASVREGDVKLTSMAFSSGRANFRIPRKPPGKRKITLEYWEGVREMEIPFEFKGG